MGILDVLKRGMVLILLLLAVMINAGAFAKNVTTEDNSVLKQEVLKNQSVISSDLEKELKEL